MCECVCLCWAAIFDSFVIVTYACAVRECVCQLQHFIAYIISAYLCRLFSSTNLSTDFAQIHHYSRLFLDHITQPCMPRASSNAIAIIILRYLSFEHRKYHKNTFASIARAAFPSHTHTPTCSLRCLVCAQQLV